MSQNFLIGLGSSLEMLGRVASCWKTNLTWQKLSPRYFSNIEAFYAFCCIIVACDCEGGDSTLCNSLIIAPNFESALYIIASCNCEGIEWELLSFFISESIIAPCFNGKSFWSTGWVRWPTTFSIFESIIAPGNFSR